MMTIHKHHLEGRGKLELPRGSKLLHIGSVVKTIFGMFG